MAGRIGAFVLRITGDTSDLADDLRRSGNQVDEYAENWNRAANLIQAAIGFIAVRAAAESVFNFIQETSQGINELLNFSEVSSIAVRDLQSIGLAASRLGLDENSVRDLVLDISERISEAVTLGTGEGLEVVNQLGLNADDLLSLSAVDRFEQLGIAIANVDNEATQLQFVRQLSGSAEEALILLRNFQEIDRASQFIDDFGFGFDIGGVEDFREAQQEIANLTAVLGALRDQFVISISPSITSFLQSLQTEEVQAFSREVFLVLQNLDQVFENLQDNGATITAFFGAISEDIAQLFAQSAIRVLQLIVESLRESSIFLEAFFEGVELLTGEISNLNDDSFRAFQNVEQLFQGGFDIEITPQIPNIDDIVTPVEEAAQSLISDDLIQSLESFADRARDSLATPLDGLQEQTRQIQLAFAAGLINEDEQNQLSARARDDYAAALESVQQIQNLQTTTALIRGTQAEFASRFDDSGQRENDRREEIEQMAIAAQREAVRETADSNSELIAELRRNTQELERARMAAAQNANTNQQGTGDQINVVELQLGAI